MGRFAIVLTGSAVCVCCVLPAYDGVDSLPGRGQGGEPTSHAGSSHAGSSNDGGRSNTTQAMGGDGTSANGGSNVGSGGKTNNGGVTATAGSQQTPGGAGGEGNEPVLGGTDEVPCPVGVEGHCAADSVFPNYPGYTLALVEDFPVPIDLEQDKVFTWSDGAVSDGQTGFRKENISFADGKMIITATTECEPTTTNSQCYVARSSYAEALSPNKTASIGKMGIWSGELRSKYNNYRYGRYEAKFTAPTANPTVGLGSFLATLFAFRSPRNPQWNEIDIQVEASKPTKIETSLVYASTNGNYPGGPSADVAGPTNFTITQEHVYAFTWTPTLVEWFVDGKSIRSYDDTGTTKIPTLSAKIMMSLWVFSGDFFGDPATNKYPFHSTYEYFRFYKQDGELKYPCQNPPACLDAVDKSSSAQNNGNEVTYGQ